MAMQPRLPEEQGPLGHRRALSQPQRRRFAVVRMPAATQGAVPVVVMSDLLDRIARGDAPGWDGRNPSRPVVSYVLCGLCRRRQSRKGRGGQPYVSAFVTMGVRRLADELGIDFRTVAESIAVLLAMDSPWFRRLATRRGQRARYLVPWPRRPRARGAGVRPQANTPEAAESVRPQANTADSQPVDNFASVRLGTDTVYAPRRTRIRRGYLRTPLPPTDRCAVGGGTGEEETPPGARPPSRLAADAAEGGLRGPGAGGQAASAATPGVDMPKTFAGRVLRPTALRELLADASRGEDRERLRMLFGSLPGAREEDEQHG